MIDILKFTRDTKPDPQKFWVFTLNNYTELETKTINHWLCTRMAVGDEIGENGTPHKQGMVVWRTARRLTQMKKILPRAHWEWGRDIEMAWNYCIKDGIFTIQDNRKQGQRKDLHDFRDAVKGGASDRELADHHIGPYLRCGNMLKRLRDAYQDEREQFTNCLFVHGPSGLRKSYWIKRCFPAHLRQFLEYDGKYFSDYRHRQVVIFDDMDMHHMSRELFLKLCNHVPYQLRCMGTYVEFNSKLVVFISNYSPNHWMGLIGCAPDNDGVFHDASIERRLTKIVEFTDETFDDQELQVEVRALLENID